MLKIALCKWSKLLYVSLYKGNVCPCESIILTCDTFLKQSHIEIVNLVVDSIKCIYNWNL